MITQVSLAVAYGGSLGIHPRAFQLVVSLYMEGEETKNSGPDECRVNMLAFFVVGLRPRKLCAPYHSSLCAALR